MGQTGDFIFYFIIHKICLCLFTLSGTSALLSVKISDSCQLLALLLGTRVK